MDILTVRVPVRFWESRRPAFSAPPLPPDAASLDRARDAEGAELATPCAYCTCAEHPYRGALCAAMDV